MRPATSDPGAKACYGVEARESSSTAPEYVVSHDPEDPAFYSTCYVRERNVTWLPRVAGKEEPLREARWRFQNHCLDCGNYHENRVRGTGGGAGVPHAFN